MCFAVKVIVVAVVDEEARRDATANDGNSSEACVSGVLVAVVAQQQEIPLIKGARIDLQLHRPVMEENPNEI